MIYDYYFYDNLYTPIECGEILEFAKNNISSEYRDDAPVWKQVRTTIVETPKIEPLLAKFFARVYEVNAKYFGFDLFPMYPWTVNLNRYDVNSQYKTHIDRTDPGQASDIKLTAILNLSQDSYTGGEFEFVFGVENKRIENIDRIGSLLIFPSFHYHRVKPVLSGERVSLSAWFMGPNWR